MLTGPGGARLTGVCGGAGQHHQHHHPRVGDAGPPRPGAVGVGGDAAHPHGGQPEVGISHVIVCDTMQGAT